ncbi:methyltransferase domain-containing protein [Chaetomium strumarium]|uniref:Protein-lysine N-methyltransferase EFM4 n=1 Tax=Chaetomium strumarium TaxID=1170767 RepID=A0AAJ0GLU5_9PEZI|nr:methyltransferase domain-containing protein [Chaetomium strumarium]
MADSATPAHLDPSDLGTKEYWDTLYEKELTNHAENPADEGTVWFDDSDAEHKIVEFLENNNITSSELGFNLDRESAAVLDLGCGNGSLLFALRDAGWNGRLLGVDYSERSVELAQRVGVSRGVLREEEGEAEERVVEFRVWDVLRGALDDVRATTPPPPPPPPPAAAAAMTQDKEGEGGNSAAAAGWDIVLDKGTFDAVSLSGERDTQGRRVCEGYGERVLQLLRTGGIFVVTSCNWTEKELRDWFETKTEALPETGARLRLAGRIEYPSFSFGGVKGQTISTLCFEKILA